MSHPIVHLDIAGPDEEPLRRFYSELLGWEVRPMGPGYALVTTPDGSPDGAIVEAERSSVSFGVAVPDLPAAVARAEATGAEIVMPPTDNGWVNKAQIADPAGNVVTLVEDRPGAD
ncbi:MAG: VOC family protein [Actinomycetota bacterium]